MSLLSDSPALDVALLPLRKLLNFDRLQVLSEKKIESLFLKEFSPPCLKKKQLFEKKKNSIYLYFNHRLKQTLETSKNKILKGGPS